MGSGGSKGYCGSASSSRSSSKTTARTLFHSSCLGSRPSNSHHLDVCEDGNIDKQGKVECRGDKAKLEDSHDLIPNVEDEVLADEWSHRPPAPNAHSDVDAEDASPPRFLSRFSFIPANVSFRLSRATSLGSSTPCHQDHTPDFLHTVPAGDTGSSNTIERGDLHSPSMFPVMDGLDVRLSDRRINSRYPVDRNVRFSRTLSVGRLRDRVLRRSSLSEQHTYCPLQQHRQARDSDLALGCDVRNLESQSNAPTSLTSPAHPSAGNGTPSFRGDEVETSRSREARYHDLLEHRSNFLERRRRIRSQVRALQRLGSRFENLSGHERSCILSGQHRTGSCTCRVINREANLSDETSSRASISRIVMLAEALFEVLDEIHQQSVVLSSRPSVSSLGSVPAPKEVVESLPIRLYTKSRTYQNEETAQCYICLVEYEEGDSTRVLPCHHEFHRSCVDKWLKEIHRVCPLCRGDICQSDSLTIAS